jgi:hypothetical protein
LGTGRFKSEAAALAQQHFGAGLDARHLPANWSSTGNALEALAFTAKDAQRLRHALSALRPRLPGLRSATRWTRPPPDAPFVRLTCSRRTSELTTTRPRFGGLRWWFACPDRVAARATGTGSVCTGFALAADTSCDGVRLVEAENTASHNPLQDEGVEAGCDPLRLSEGSSPSRTRTYNKPVNSRLLYH